MDPSDLYPWFNQALTKSTTTANGWYKKLTEKNLITTNGSSRQKRFKKGNLKLVKSLFKGDIPSLPPADSQVLK